MSRVKSEHGERGDVGGDYTVPPKGEYNTIVWSFADGEHEGTKILNVSLAIAGGDYDEKITRASFFRRVGSEREEKKMETFLHFLGLAQALEDAIPNGNSWLDDSAIEWIKLHTERKPIRVDTYVKKGKPNAEGKVYDNSEVSAFMFAGNGVATDNANSPSQPVGQSSGTAID